MYITYITLEYFFPTYLHEDVEGEGYHDQVVDYQHGLEVEGRPAGHDLWTQVAHEQVPQAEGDGGPGGVHQQPRLHPNI